MAAELQTPKLRVEQQEADYVKLVMEPLNEGFGVTVGNALRRVLLSSLPGAAITSVRIDGVDHEFSTVEHMREDVTELLLNLKEVRLRAHADRPARLFLEAAGETEVRAGDVQATADYEIANPALHLARLDNPDASLVIDLNVETGRGYQPAAAAEGLPIGVIPIDALFTPVRRVNYRVANTRVGQDTNFDRLELEVWTDGTIDGEQAIAQAAAILREQLQPLGALGGDEGAGEREAAAASTPPGHDMLVEALNLSNRSLNSLKRSGFGTVGAPPWPRGGGDDGDPRATAAAAVAPTRHRADRAGAAEQLGHPSGQRGFRGTPTQRLPTLTTRQASRARRSGPRSWRIRQSAAIRA